MLHKRRLSSLVESKAIFATFQMTTLAIVLAIVQQNGERLPDSTRVFSSRHCLFLFTPLRLDKKEISSELVSFPLYANPTIESIKQTIKDAFASFVPSSSTAPNFIHMILAIQYFNLFYLLCPFAMIGPYMPPLCYMAPWNESEISEANSYNEMVTPFSRLFALMPYRPVSRLGEDGKSAKIK